MKKVCLVLEGGAMRGIYTSAIIDTFLDEDIKIDALIGVSAGALFGVNYVSKQKGRSLRYNKKYINNKKQPVCERKNRPNFSTGSKL